MPVTLFGELEVSKSFGHTPVNSPKYIGHNILCYASGNVFNFIDTQKQSKNIKPIVADAQITAFGTNRRESLIAYSERGSNAVQIVKYPLGSSIGEYSIEKNIDIGVVSIEFSHDGKYLAALGDLPTYTLTVWSWKNNTIICSIENGGPAKYVSFNPFNTKELCTSGEEGLIQFWKLEMGYKENSLKSITGTDAFLQEIPEINHSSEFSTFTASTEVLTQGAPAILEASRQIFCSSHVWQIDAQVLATCETGDAVLQYNPVTGDCKVLFSAWMSPYEFEQRRIASENGKATDAGVEGLDEDERPPFTEDYVKAEYGGCENFKCILATKDRIVLGGKDGVLRIVDYDGDVHRQAEILTNGSSIQSISYSPEFEDIVVTASDMCIYTYNLASSVVTQQAQNEYSNIVGLAIFPISDVLVTAHNLPNVIQFWDMETQVGTHKLAIEGEIATIAVNPMSSVIAVGTKAGFVRLYDVAFAKSDEARLLMRIRVSRMVIKKVTFDPTGRFLLAFGHESSASIFDVFNKCKPVGLISDIPGSIVTAVWDLEESEDPESETYNTKQNLMLYFLTTSASRSDIFRYEVPLNKDLVLDTVGDSSLQKQIPLAAKYRIDEVASDILIVSTGVSSSRAFYVTTKDKKLKTFACPTGHDDVAEFIELGAPLLEFSDHEKIGNRLVLSLSTEWLFTYSPDGTITARNFLEPEKSVKIFAHDSALGGVHHVAISRDANQIFSSGFDGILKQFEWKTHTAAARRALIEAREAAEAALSQKLESINHVVQMLSNAPIQTDDQPDNINEDCYFESRHVDSGAKPASDLATGPEAAHSGYEDRIKAIRERLIKAMQKNDALQELEKISKTEFILDFAERDRLMAAADARVTEVRKEIELENLKKRVIRNRIKAECWDSMEVIGGCIKSFHADPTTTKTTEVTNYPIKNKSTQEIQNIERVRLLRKIQLHYGAGNRDKAPSQQLTAPVVDDVGLLETPVATESPVIPDEEAYQDFKSLLYSDFELTTDHRKRTQVVLLGEAINEIKLDFNGKFKEFLKIKKDEMLRIEDKNDRIQTIMAELQVQEATFKPALDDDEVPERIIEVNDSEVKAEKFIGPEEMKRIEVRKREEEERHRAAQEDNYRERGLMIMMGGKLDDKSEETEKEELVRPEWMNKPREEMNEEERKLVKEFEKKVATMKEEQEKYRKALETELKKLQGFILELCDNFDQRLKELLVKKLEADQAIYKNELKRVKLEQSILLAEGDEAKESQLNLRLEELRLEKQACLQYLPEIKKELDHCRDEYEITQKRDKEIEKSFRKEFANPGNPDVFDNYLKLFKKRELVKPTNLDAQQNVIESPFPGIDPTLMTLDSPEETYAPLSFERDAFEGISQDGWTRLNEFHDRKIASEAEVKTCNKEYTEIQSLAQSVNEEADRIRKETEHVLSDLAAFAEYKFHTTYNPETLFELKQGQVEVPQAPVVTDYTDAELIHRSVVEKLNDNIVALGNMKVDALKEMKEYRKGIHALEWENKMLDFQAEDLVIRTRDIQLLRVTKQMQEYIRGGDEKKQSNEIIALEKRAEFNSKSHIHKLEDKGTLMVKYKKKIAEKRHENEVLERRLRNLEGAVKERRKIHDVQVKRKTAAGGGGTSAGNKAVLNDIYTRRKLVDLAKSQSQDIAILREEVERLRLRTYPAFPSRTVHSVAGV
ncbi:hypothetical protein BC830DRAFT_1230957 [Chytriomyces sp. MP71]|nr:hypothetical protein BC830DRAFT_1230957 [Chytriomyces sp. MP71]